MMAEWKTIKVGDIGQIITGKTPKTYNSSYYGGIIPFLTPSDDMSVKYVRETKKSITEDGRLSVKNATLPANAVCVSCIGSDLGKVVITTERTVTNQQINSIVINEDNYDIDYIYYAMVELGKILNFHSKTSTAVPIVNKSSFSQYELKCPPLEIQKKIGKLLSSIDSKIEENERINNNLEQQAKVLFKSWFIDFEPFGGVQPPEMKFIPLQELCKVVTKGTTPTTLGKPFTSSGINFIKAESILDNHSIDSSKFAFVDEETNALLKRSVIKANDIVFTIAGTLGRFAMVDNTVLPANTNQAVAIIRPDENKVTPSYLYSFFIGNWHNEYYSKRIQQAVQANLSLTTIKSLPIAVLSNATMNNYNELVSPLFALMKSNEEENRRLSELRDTLLPKLMSGELDVSTINL